MEKIQLYIVVAPPWSGGNHLLNILRTSNIFYNSIPKDHQKRFYNENTEKNFHNNTDYNIADFTALHSILQKVNSTVDPIAVRIHLSQMILFYEELKTKPLNPMALEQMAKKCIQPKKQPREIFLIIIVPSHKRVHIGVSVPDGMNINIDEFIKNSFQNDINYSSGMGFEVKYNINKIDEKLVYIDYEIDKNVPKIRYNDERRSGK